MKKTLGVNSSTCPEIVMDLTSKLMMKFVRTQMGLPEDKEINTEIEKQNRIILPGFTSKVVQDNTSMKDQLILGMNCQIFLD